MGFSKKKQKSWRKSQKRVGEKAKAKAKKATVIETSKQRKESKRKAVILSGKADPGTPGEGKPRAALSELESVDALFAHLDKGGDVEDDGSDESSAGAFQDADEDEDDEGDDILETDGIPAGEVGDANESNINLDAEHVEELRILKEKDPEFYNFLLNEDKALLDFSVTDMPDGEKDEDEAESDADAEEAPPQAGNTLTADRWQRIQAMAPSTFTACKVALNAYHIAVRSIEAGSGAGFGQKSAMSTGRKSKGQLKRERMAILHIESEEVFSQVLEWMVPNFVSCITQHAGKLRGGGERKQKKSSRFGSAFAGGVVVDPFRYARWMRVRTVASIFWTDTLFLLTRLKAQPMIEFVLRTCSTPQALSWLWPFKGLRLRFFRKCCNLWSTAPSHSVRLLAFLFLRNSVAMELEVPDIRPSETPKPEFLTRMVLKSFFEVAAWGYSWRNLSTFRFMENALVELLRLDDGTTYRVGYAYVRQLAMVLRKACVPVEKKDDTKQKKPKEDTRDRNERKKGYHKMDPEKQEGKKKDMAKQLKDRGRRKTGQEQILVSWPFVRSIYMWTKAISELPSLRPLAYPFFMIVMGAMKVKATHLQQFPFVYHCMWCLNQLSYSLDVFVPISSHVLVVLGTLITAMTKARRVRAVKGASQTLDKAKAPEVEVLLHFTEGQTTDQMTLEVVGGSLCFLLTTHLGLLSQSPSFPEISAPVIVHVRKHSKHCPSESLRHQLKTLVTTIETSAEDVRARRDALTEAPASDKFLIFEADTALAKARALALQRKAAQEKNRVEAELAADRKAAEQSAKKKKKARKAEGYLGDDTEDEGAKEEEAEEKPHKPRKKRKKVADAPDASGRPTLTGEAVLAAMAAAGATKEDLLEVEGLSSDDD